ncbi:hypothetical protein Hanom_Chr05g00400681 [Helianthus anomalus]
MLESNNMSKIYNSELFDFVILSIGCQLKHILPTTITRDLSYSYRQSKDSK